MRFTSIPMKVLRLPLIKVKDRYNEDYSHEIGKDTHDNLYIDPETNSIRYRNHQCGEETSSEKEFSVYEFGGIDMLNVIQCLDKQAEMVNLDKNKRYLELKEELIRMLEKALVKECQERIKELDKFFEKMNKENGK